MWVSGAKLSVVISLHDCLYKCLSFNYSTTMPPLRKSWRQGRAVGFLWQVGGMTRQRLVHLSGTHNFRDTGGYRVGASVARWERSYGRMSSTGSTTPGAGSWLSWA